MKEVVHVPTRELAEEVLRAAKENGFKMPRFELEYYLKTSGEELCFRFNEAYFSFANKCFYKEEGYTIITVKEFLDRYKSKFRPIAMRCNKEQFEAVKGKLDGFEFSSIFNFDIYKYLVNNNSGREMNVTNVNTPGTEYNRQVFEEWDEKTFLEYCGIEVKDEVNELEKLRKENESLKKHYNNVEQELKHLNNELSKELGLVKKQLKEIQDQPKVGDVCLFWDKGNRYFTTAIYSEGNMIKGVGKYHNCIKATDENIKAKIKELQDEN